MQDADRDGVCVLGTLDGEKSGGGIICRSLFCTRLVSFPDIRVGGIFELWVMHMLLMLV